MKRIMKLIFFSFIVCFVNSTKIMASGYTVQGLPMEFTKPINPSERQIAKKDGLWHIDVSTGYFLKAGYTGVIYNKDNLWGGKDSDTVAISLCLDPANHTNTDRITPYVEMLSDDSVYKMYKYFISRIRDKSDLTYARSYLQYALRFWIIDAGRSITPDYSSDSDWFKNCKTKLESKESNVGCWGNDSNRNQIINYYGARNGINSSIDWNWNWSGKINPTMRIDETTGNFIFDFPIQGVSEFFRLGSAIGDIGLGEATIVADFSVNHNNFTTVRDYLSKIGLNSNDIGVNQGVATNVSQTNFSIIMTPEVARIYNGTDITLNLKYQHPLNIDNLFIANPGDNAQRMLVIHNAISQFQIDYTIEIDESKCDYDETNRVYTSWEPDVTYSSLEDVIGSGKCICNDFKTLYNSGKMSETDKIYYENNCIFSCKYMGKDSNNFDLFQDYNGVKYNSLYGYLNDNKGEVEPCSCYDVKDAYDKGLLTNDNNIAYEEICGEVKACEQTGTDSFLDGQGKETNSVEKYFNTGCGCDKIIDSSLLTGSNLDKYKEKCTKSCVQEGVAPMTFYGEMGDKVTIDKYINKCGCDKVNTSYGLSISDADIYGNMCLCKHLEPVDGKDVFRTGTGNIVNTVNEFINGFCTCEDINKDKLIVESNKEQYNDTSCVTKEICKQDESDRNKFIVNKDGITETDDIDVYLSKCDCNLNTSLLSPENKNKYNNHEKCKIVLTENITDCPEADYEDINSGDDDNYYGFNLNREETDNKWSSEYYKMKCTENILVENLKGKYKTLAGMQFGFDRNPSMIATKKCVLSVNYSAWKNIYNELYAENRALYERYLKFKAISVDFNGTYEGTIIQGGIAGTPVGCRYSAWIGSEKKSISFNFSEIPGVVCCPGSLTCGTDQIPSENAIKSYCERLGDKLTYKEDDDNRIVTKIKKHLKKLNNIPSVILEPPEAKNYYSVWDHELTYNYQQTLPNGNILKNIDEPDYGRVNDRGFNKEGEDSPNESIIDRETEERFEYYTKDGIKYTDLISVYDNFRDDDITREVKYEIGYSSSADKISNAYTGKVQIGGTGTNIIGLDKAYDTDFTAVAKTGNETSYVFELGSNNNSALLKSKLDAGINKITTTCDYQIFNELFDCPGGTCGEPQLNVVYRSVDPNNVDPNDRVSKDDEGMSNWKSDEAKAVLKKIESDAVGNNTFNPDKLEYSFKLDSVTIQEIRESNNSDKYAGFDLNCDSDGNKCESAFINVYVSNTVKDVSGTINGRKTWKEITKDAATGKYKIDGVLVN